ncbi:CBM20 domain-containing protein [Clostridium hydrogenum]|uniref:CBM20 domain-containing protein n=1 Tax=Clostridium hydrogenum TaxID=2855764 RepID=UPI001F3855CB|nr:CBM20 domain-containing protein [Clostridium hydrogenum]
MKKTVQKKTSSRKAAVSETSIAKKTAEIKKAASSTAASKSQEIKVSKSTPPRKTTKTTTPKLKNDAPKAEDQTINFTFILNDKNSYFGENIFVCGNIDELGNWDTSKAVSLTTDESLYPTWKGTATLPLNTYIEFKFVSVSSDGVVTWEESENRAATITKDNILYEGNWN